MRIAITGERGFIGRHLAAILAERAHEVVPINRNDWDLTSQGSPGALIKGCDALVHLAAYVHIRGQQNDAEFVRRMSETNHRGTEFLARTAAVQGVPRFVFMSSAAVFGHGSSSQVIDESSPLQPDTPYGQSKLAAERGLESISKDTGMVTVALRPPIVYGPGAAGNFGKLVRLVSRGLPIPSGALTARRAFISVTNLCNLVIRALGATGTIRKAYVAAEPARPIGDLYYGLCKMAGRRPVIIPTPRAALRLALNLSGRFEMARAVLDDFLMDASAARRELDWSPEDLFTEELDRAMAEQNRRDRS